MKQNKTVLKTFEILNIISQREDGITFSEIVNEMDIPKSTVHDILTTLFSIDAVYFKDDRIKNYVIGSKLFSLGSAYSNTSKLINSSKPYIKELSQKLEKTMMITKYLDNELFCVYNYQPKNSLLTAPHLGVMYGEEGIKKLFRGIKRGENISQSSGYLIEGIDDDILKISVAIMNIENRAVGCITLIGINKNNEYKDALQTLWKVAEDISKRLGFKLKYNNYFLSK